jgi:hypothetical protein
MKWLVARGRFELPSAGPKPAMIVHYTTGLDVFNAYVLCYNFIASINFNVQNLISEDRIGNNSHLF